MAGKHPKYIYEILKRKSFMDFVIALGGKADIKEWSEIYAIYDKLRTLDFEPDLVIDMACGKRPTLGTFLALNIKSLKEIHAVDPQLDITLAKNINKLFLFNCKLNQYVNDYLDSKHKSCVLCACHGHITKTEAQKLLSKFDKWVYVTMPCCVENKLDYGKYYIDKCVHSPKNTIYISSNIGKED